MERSLKAFTFMSFSFILIRIFLKENRNKKVASITISIVLCHCYSLYFSLPHSFAPAIVEGHKLIIWIVNKLVSGCIIARIASVNGDILLWELGIIYVIFLEMTNPVYSIDSKWGGGGGVDVRCLHRRRIVTICLCHFYFISHIMLDDMAFRVEAWKRIKSLARLKIWNSVDMFSTFLLVWDKYKSINSNKK